MVQFAIALRMRWTSDFLTETTIAEIAARPFFCSAAPQVILPSRPSILQPPRAGAVKAGHTCGQGQALRWPARARWHAAWNGTGQAGSCRQLRLWLSGAGDLVAKRDASAASVTGLPMLSCRIEAPARPLLVAALSIATR